jgi:hypothetical protein
MTIHYSPIRNLDGEIYRENFFVAAIFSMLAIRGYLYLTGYPQIGGGGLHIAHMLWGGFFMMIALVLVFSFLNKGTLHVASILGGIGFGTFIDELGKFITSDNNYFFQPTIAIIYVIFVLLFLSMKAIGRYPPVSKQEYLINAMQLAQDAVLNDLDRDEEKQARVYLKKADHKNPITKSLRALLHEVEAITPPKPSMLTRCVRRIKHVYYRITNWRRIMTVVIIAFVINALYVILDTANVFVNNLTLSFSESARLYCAIFAGLFVIAGLIILRYNRLRSYRYFKIAVLINIFLTQVFTFYQDQFEALIGLSIYILLLLFLDYGIAREREKLATEIVSVT